jgi:1-acyl-sn-glycerol-3-phosphate acyltransferase
VELEGIRKLTETLKAGHIVLLFPEGGTWEKPLSQAKPGAAYLSMITQTPVLPVGVWGTYDVWGKTFRLQRPEVWVKFGEVLAPVASVSRERREQALQDATREIMEAIYRLLPGPGQIWYDQQAQLAYSCYVEVWHGSQPHMQNIPGQAALAEVMLKANLLNPLFRNGQIPLDPLRYAGYAFGKTSYDLMLKYLKPALAQGGAFHGYFNYRLGDEKAAQFDFAIDALAKLISTPGVDKIVLKPIKIFGGQTNR